MEGFTDLVNLKKLYLEKNQISYFAYTVTHERVETWQKFKQFQNNQLTVNKN